MSGNGQAPSAQQPQHQLIVTLFRGGGMNVSGDAMNNLILAFGMLEMAKDLIREHFKANKSDVRPPSPLELKILGRP